MAVYIPPPTLSCPCPPVYYVIRADMNLLTVGGDTTITPLAVQMIGDYIRKYACIDGYKPTVRIVYPEEPCDDDNTYEVYILYPRAVLVHTQEGPVYLPQIGESCEAKAEALTLLFTTGTPTYIQLLATVNAKLVDKLQLIEFPNGFHYDGNYPKAHKPHPCAGPWKLCTTRLQK